MGYSNQGESKNGGLGGTVCLSSKHLAMQSYVLSNRLYFKLAPLWLEDCTRDWQPTYGVVE